VPGCMKEKIKIEDKIDITDEVSTYSTKDLASLLIFLDKNEFKKIYFDGYNASIEVFRERFVEG
jgi:hypothetical protein